jgi:hypothetical protein
MSESGRSTQRAMHARVSKLEGLPEQVDELGKIVTFMASDQAGPMTATFANISCGAILD